MSPSELILWGVLAGAPAFPFLVTLVNLWSWRRGQVGAPGNEDVSLLIPARNEAANIVECVERADAVAPRGAEILVYDDQSADGTCNLLAELACQIPRLRVLRGKALPDGWVGKAHACHRLAKAARGDILVFVDADTRLLPEGITRLLSFLAPNAKADMVTAVPRQEAGGLFERMILPLLTLTYVAWLPLFLIGRTRSTRFVAANGQLLAIRATAYRAIGGFAAVRNEIVEDLALVRHAKRCGLRVEFADGFHMASCRMYRSAREVWRGFSKNIYEGLGESPLRISLAALLYITCFVLPYPTAAIAVGAGGGLLAPALVGVGINLLLRSILTWRYRQPGEGILLHPLSVCALLAMAANSWRWTLSGRISWRGRGYLPRRERSRLLPSPSSPPAHRPAHPFVIAVAHRHVKRKLGRAFENVRIAGLERIGALLKSEPLIVVSNHVSWWDPLILLLLDGLLGAKSSALMDARNLQRWPFFGWVGALPVHMDQPHCLVADLRRAISTLTGPGRILWLFPQGSQRPAHLRPLRLKRGAELVASQSGARVIPMGLNYLYGEEPQPAAFVSLGAPMTPDSAEKGALSAQMASAIEAELSSIDREATMPNTGFTPVYPTRGHDGVPWQGRLLARMMRRTP